MLQSLIPAMQYSSLAIFPLAMLLAFVSRRPQGDLRNWLRRGATLGIGGAFIFAALELLQPGLLEREIYEGWVLGLALPGEALLLSALWRAWKKGYPGASGNIPGWLVALVAATVLLHRAPEIFLFSIRVLTSSSALFSSEFIFKLAGILLGASLALMAGLAVLRVAPALPESILLTVTTAGFLVVMGEQAVIVIQVLLVRGLIPMSQWLLGMMIPLINYQDWFFYFLMATVASLPVFLFLQRQPLEAKGLNPAERRKIRAALRAQWRWGGAAALTLALAVFLAVAGKVYASAEGKLFPAQPVTVDKGEIKIPLETVDDGRLHRFAYTAQDGTEVRFIVIKKGGSAYGVGLDACDICGPTGYYQRKGQVVCKRCDVVINTPTVGYKGGCNPIPFEYRIASGQLVIQAAVLEKEKERFQ
ncbi:Fe-S-containing protein [Neomoorella carbonis]|uniref:Fe-S-containing protein n=1 Tax=Neomoorella carbonis TaxID=3062783 RepID=UPI00324CC928